jgi:hypothetical protein
VFGRVEGAHGGRAPRCPREGAYIEHHRHTHREGGPQLARLQPVWCEVGCALAPMTCEFGSGQEAWVNLVRRVVGFESGYGYDNW